MGLVDYSESESSGSESEAPRKTAQRTAQSAASKKPFQKVVDRSNPGKIVVNLPHAQAESSSDEPPTKKARTAGPGRFAGFNSLLPAPKNANKPTSSSTPSKHGVNLKTSAAPGFSRDVDEESGVYGQTEENGTGLMLPPPKKNEPFIPEGQKSADEVKLVGKPLMFRPLSVARDSKKKNKSKTARLENAQTTPAVTTADNEQTAAVTEPPKKVSLFSLPAHDEAETEAPAANGAYEPLFEGHIEADTSDAWADYAAAQANAPGTTESLDVVADDLNLSAAARRDLFGRGGNKYEAKKIVNFNMDKEYEHNEEMRALGEQQTHNALRTIQGGGKHSLKQLVQNVQSQRDVYEDTFARNKSNRKAAASRYGW